MILLLTESYKICLDVLRGRSGEIVPPDHDKDGLYDLNFDCLWIVEAPADYLIQFQIYFVDMESTIGCAKDFLKVLYTQVAFALT